MTAELPQEAGRAEQDQSASRLDVVRPRAFDSVFLKRLGAVAVTITAAGLFLINRAGDRADDTVALANNNARQILVDAKAAVCSSGSGLIINLDIVTMGPLRSEVSAAGDEIAGLNTNTGVLAEVLSEGETTTTTQMQQSEFDPLSNPFVDENMTVDSQLQVSSPEFEKPCPPITTTLPPQK